MTARTEGDEVVFRIFAFHGVRLHVMQFEVPRIGPVPFGVTPTASRAVIVVPPQNGPPDGVGYLSIVLGALPVPFKHINTNR